MCARFLSFSITTGTPVPTIIPVSHPETTARVAELDRDIWVEHYRNIIHPAQIQYMLDRFQSPQAIAQQMASDDFRYYLINHLDEDVGYFALVPNTPPPEGVFLSKIYIRRHARRKGLGKIALDFAITWTRLAGGSYLWLTVNKNNTASIAWYLRRGFVNEGSVVSDIGGGYVMDDYKMSLQLGGPETSGAY